MSFRTEPPIAPTRASAARPCAALPFTHPAHRSGAHRAGLAATRGPAPRSQRTSKRSRTLERGGKRWNRDFSTGKRKLPNGVLRFKFGANLSNRRSTHCSNHFPAGKRLSPVESGRAFSGDSARSRAVPRFVPRVPATATARGIHRPPRRPPAGAVGAGCRRLRPLPTCGGLRRRGSARRRVVAHGERAPMRHREQGHPLTRRRRHARARDDVVVVRCGTSRAAFPGASDSQPAAGTGPPPHCVLRAPVGRGRVAQGTLFSTVRVVAQRVA